MLRGLSNYIRLGQHKVEGALKLRLGGLTLGLGGHNVEGAIKLGFGGPHTRPWGPKVEY